MTYKVIPFAAKFGSDDDAGAAAAQLERVILAHETEGWEYVRLEHVDTVISGSNGCFGIGAQPDRQASIAMAVFRR